MISVLEHILHSHGTEDHTIDQIDHRSKILFVIFVFIFIPQTLIIFLSPFLLVTFATPHSSAFATSNIFTIITVYQLKTVF